MFHKLLLPVDLTDRHGQALAAATDLARPGGGEVTLLHVIEVIPGLTMEEEKPFYQRLEKAARKHLDGLGGRFAKAGVRWRPEIRFGARAAEVVRHAAETGADLIVLTSPRFDPERPAAGWGSLSHKIGLLSACPVLLVK
jgi:nucleotide-binding universal stress UspA family protein